MTPNDEFFGFTVHEVLMGAIQPGADPELLRERFVSSGGADIDLIVLEGQDGLDQLRGHQAGAEPMRTFHHLLRHLDGLDSGATGHVLATADAELTRGKKVVVVRGVNKDDAPPLADLLKANGVPHVHYVGKWTTNEHGGT